MMHPRFSAKLSQVIGVPSTELTDETELGAADWDSVAVLDLIAAMDEAYGITVSSRAIYSAATVGDLRALMRASGADV